LLKQYLAKPQHDQPHLTRPRQGPIAPDLTPPNLCSMPSFHSL